MKVDVQQVEAELAQIQRELTSSEVRASLFNLVVQSSDVHRAQADAALTYLLGKRAARVIHIVRQDVPESSLEVSARCTVDAERKGVCFQEIVITNGNDAAGGALGSWTPLLVRDIPTYVVWLDAIGDRKSLFELVQTQVDKLILDSDRAIELGDSEAQVLRTLRKAAVERNVPVADFAWKRLRPHRQLAANAFSGKAGEQLGRITSVRIKGLSQASSRLYGLWLAERLGWSNPEFGETDRYRAPGEKSVSVHRESGEPGCDQQIEFSLADGRTVELNTTMNGCADIENADGDEHREMVSIPSEGEILLEEVDAVYADSLYKAALELIPPVA